MLKRLVDFFTSGEGRSSFKFTLQDIALCQLWYDGQTRLGVDEPVMAQIREQITRWKAEIPSQGQATAGQRHQRLLRVLLDQLRLGTMSSLNADEVAFLAVACALAEGCTSTTTHQRFLERISPHRQELLNLRAQLTPSDDVHQLEPHIQYAAEADIQAAEVTAIRLLAGIELPCRGPVFRSGNHLRILGDVPDGCTVVVENEGSCSVDGYVMGRILTRGHCEIRHNISGVAIVLNGHVRARSIINNALVVSKLGRVVCVNAQGPALIFAGSAIEVAAGAMLGKYVTRDMTVGDEVRGGHLEIAGTAKARKFSHLGMRNMVVVLRRELSCEDFGEVTGDELKQLLSKAYSLRRKAHNFRNMAEAAGRDGEHTAQSALMFIFGGGEVQKRLQEFLQAQRRHTLVSNVVDNLQHILEQAQDSLIGSVHDGESPDTTLDDHEDLAQDEELMGARADAEKLHKSLRVRNLDRTQRTLILEEVREKVTQMLVLQEQTAAKMKEVERSIQHLEKYEQVLAGSGEGATKIEVLKKILPAMRNQPPDSPMGQRLRSTFVVRALRGVNRALRHAAEFGEQAEKNLQDFRAVSERLGKDFQIHVLENPGREGESARITGVFDGGTRIFMDVYVEDLSEVPSDAILTTPDERAVRTYIRSSSGDGYHKSDNT